MAELDENALNEALKNNPDKDSLIKIAKSNNTKNATSSVVS